MIFLYCCSTLHAAISQQQQTETYKQLELFSNVLSILQENYVEEIKTKEVVNGAIQGLLYSLDPHSSYLPPDDFKDLQEETRGTYPGIGIEVTIKDDLLTVISPIANTPADRAGIKAKDVIVAIDGVKTKNMGPWDAINKLRGPAGSDVKISIHREGWDEVKDFTLKREVIPLQSVKMELLAPGLIYSRITNFQSHTVKDYKQKLEDLRAQGPIKGAILDLRNNPGGLLHQAVGLCDIFLKSGTIVYTKGRRADQNTTFVAHDNGEKNDFPLVLLVNEGSASAAEIVAGAIQAQKRGILVGTRTFGKGSVQTIIPLPDGAGLRMTTAMYYTPDDRSIQALGIVPDVEVPAITCLPPGADLTQKKRLTEADLDNHLPGTGEQTESMPDAEDGGDILDTSNDVGKNLEDRLNADNQLRTAYNILKSLNLFSLYGKNSAR